MKIAVFIKSTTYHKGYGGLETQNKMLCEGLASKGHTVVVFSPKKDVHADIKNENGIEYHFVDSVYGTVKQWISSKGWYKKSYEIFLAVHKATPFDIVISQSSAGLGIIKNKHVLNIPLLSIAHGSIVSEFNTRLSNHSGITGTIKLVPDTIFTIYNFFFRQREFVHGSDKVVCVSEYVKKVLAEECIAEPQKFVVIHNGVDASKIVDTSGVGDTKSQVTVLWVSQVIKEKGADNICKIFNTPELSPIKLVIAGDGAYAEKLKSQAKSLNMTNINFVGKKNFDDLIKLYLTSDIFIFPTNRIEGFPMVLVEAMLAGLPIVAFDLGGTSDAVLNGQTGYLVPPLEITTFSEKISALVKDADLRKEFGNKAKEIALNNFTLDNMINQYEKFMLELINK